MTKRSSALVLLGALLSVTLLWAAKPDYHTTGRAWVKGPVKWIMTKEEIKSFKRLRDDAAREAFIEAFWAERDPTPDTPANEYKIVFWQKVESADQAFSTMTQTGALTDFGRVFLLLGRPTDIDKDSRNYQTWVYEPDDINKLTERFEVRFAPKPPAGSLLLAKKDLEEVVTAHPATRGIGWTVPVLAQAGTPDVPTETREPEEDLSPESLRQIPILEAVLASGSGPTDVPFKTTYDYYAAADGSTLVVLTVEAPRQAAHGSGDSALLPFARLAPEAEGRRPVNLTGDLPFLPAPIGAHPQESYIYQARHNLAPGTYTVVAVVEDKVVNGQMGSLVQKIIVPDYSQRRFEVSSVSMLAQFKKIEAGLGPDEESRGPGPYVMGSFRLVPRASRVLEKTEALSFYYQIYNPAGDPASGRPSLEATYSFFLKEDGAWKPFRKPIVKAQGQVELYSIDLQNLLKPDQILPAEFKMIAKIADKVGGQEITRDLLFTVR